MWIGDRVVPCRVWNAAQSLVYNGSPFRAANTPYSFGTVRMPFSVRRSNAAVTSSRGSARSGSMLRSESA